MKKIIFILILINLILCDNSNKDIKLNAFSIKINSGILIPGYNYLNSHFFGGAINLELSNNYRIGISYDFGNLMINNENIADTNEAVNFLFGIIEKVKKKSDNNLITYFGLGNINLQNVKISAFLFGLGIEYNIKNNLSFEIFLKDYFTQLASSGISIPSGNISAHSGGEHIILIGIGLKKSFTYQ